MTNHWSLPIKDHNPDFIIEAMGRILDSPETMGIFRISSASSSLLELRTHCEQTGILPDETETETNTYTVHDYAGLVKQFLREHPLPFPADTVVNTPLSVADIKKLFSTLSDAETYFWEFIFISLSTIASHSEVNKMSSKNLGIVFSSAVFKDDPGNLMASLMNAPKLTKFIEFLLNNVDNIFSSD